MLCHAHSPFAQPSVSYRFPATEGQRLDHPDSLSDELLIAAANGGDASAFSALYLRYRDWVVRLGRRFAGNDEDALDVLQETFTYVFRKFPGFHLTASMTTFLYPVVKNLSLVACRKRDKFEGNSDALAELPAPIIDPDNSRSELAAAMANLAETHREVVLMRFVDEMSLDEIAVALAIPVGTVKSRLHHALATLRADPKARRYFDPN